MKRRDVLRVAGLATSCLGWPALAATPRAKGSPRPTSRTAVGRIRTAGVLKVAVVQQFPWATLKGAADWSGFDIDVCNRIAADLDVEAEYLDTAWNAAADDVAQGVTDIAASLHPTPQRALVVNFSRAYGESLTTLISRRDKATGMATIDAVNQPGSVIGVRGGGQVERLAREQFGKAQIRAFADEAEGIRALEAGEIMAMLAQTPLPEIVAARADGPLVLPLAQPLRRRNEALAVRIEDTDLLAYLNIWLGHAEETGWLAERRRYWFESGAAKG